MKSNGLLVYVYLLYILVNVCARILGLLLLEWYMPAHSHTHKPKELAKVKGQCRVYYGC